MKNLKMLLATGFLALLTACGTTKNNTSNTTSDTQATNRGRSNTEMTTTGTPSKSPTATSSGRVVRNSSERNATTTTTTRTTTATNQNDAAANKAKVKREKMYTDLDMSEEQINRFESEWRSATNSFSGRNTNQNMNNFERAEAQDRIMKGILNEGQFAKYQQWARDNAGSVDGE